ncbi:dephospho-CoA kinase [Rothia sp. LK2588]|uniref:dephospho-CoA kinase n=1 Tax=Rothia sp. LK2588 TaxID=3114369 RepID=UPI0034CF8EA0
MQRIGLTGGIGSGKSTVAEMLAAQGAVIIDADRISRQLMEPGEEVLARVVETFGPDILDEQGRLDRSRLAQLIFADSVARDALNAIVHPAVRQRSFEIADAAQQAEDFSGVIVEDIPLLVETGQVSRFDAVIVVYADLETRLDRLVAQRGMSEQDARARIASQATDEQRAAVATWIVDNSGTREQTEENVKKIWAEIQAHSFIN